MAGSCRDDGDVFKALFSCPDNPSAAEVSTHAWGASLGGPIRGLFCKQMVLTQSYIYWQEPK